MLTSERRTRTLGLGATVRAFNDLAVPGLGGVWFGKQLLLATLGVAVAEGVQDGDKRAKNIEVANAVEALACWLALKKSDWQRDPRLRGATKMRHNDNLSFAAMRKPSFYVTQPMRQATVQPLRALGLVESMGERFNAFACTPIGLDFIEAAFAGFSPSGRKVLTHLIGWVRGEHSKIITPKVAQALSPLESMPESARYFLRERIVQGCERRRQALEWVQELQDKPQKEANWKTKPEVISEDHWKDLRAGAQFFMARDTAIELLDKIEELVANETEQCWLLDRPFPAGVVKQLNRLRQKAQAFLNGDHDPSPQKLATTFCRECTEPSDSRLLENLLQREGRVLRLRERDRAIVPGDAFRGTLAMTSSSARSREDDGSETEIEQVVPLPEGISHRVRNLYLLNLDLNDQLDDWLGKPSDDSGSST